MKCIAENNIKKYTHMEKVKQGSVSRIFCSRRFNSKGHLD